MPENFFKLFQLAFAIWFAPGNGITTEGAPGEWSVEAIEVNGDGDCYVTIFTGPEAEQRANE